MHRTRTLILTTAATLLEDFATMRLKAPFVPPAPAAARRPAST